MRWNFKLNPRLDIEREVAERESTTYNGPYDVASPSDHSRASSSGKPKSGRSPEPEMTGVSPYGASIPAHIRGSQIDMATGQRSQSRGFGFSAEEGGVEMRRIQSNLSGRSGPQVGSRRKGSTLLKSLKRPLRRKKLTTAEEVHEGA